MDLATMILEKSHQMAKEEELNSMVQMNLKFDKDDVYTIHVKQHPKLRNSIVLEYMNVKFNLKKNSCKCCQSVGYIFRQICRSYLVKNKKDYFDAGDYLEIDVRCKGAQISYDMHSICEKINFDEMSISTNAEVESDEFDFLYKFFMDYFNFVESIDI